VLGLVCRVRPSSTSIYTTFIYICPTTSILHLYLPSQPPYFQSYIFHILISPIYFSFNLHLTSSFILPLSSLSNRPLIPISYSHLHYPAIYSIRYGSISSLTSSAISFICCHLPPPPTIFYHLTRTVYIGTLRLSNFYCNHVFASPPHLLTFTYCHL
jgi:hypothetical protein